MQPLLTNEMKVLLNECYQREMQGIEPCSPSTEGLANDLIVNGFLMLKPHTYLNGARKAAYFITEKGRKYIKENK